MSYKDSAHRNFWQYTQGEAEQEEPEGEVAATCNEQASQPILANINRQRSEDAVSKDGTASQCSVRSIGVESTGYLSDDEGDDDYIHIFNTEYSFSDRESDDGDRASFRSFRWSSSKQSLTSLLETVSEEAPLADEASEIVEEENASQHQSVLHLEPDIKDKDLEILYASSVNVSQEKTFEFTESDGEFVHLSRPSHLDASLGNAEVQTFSLETTDTLRNDRNNNDVVHEEHKLNIEPKKPQFFIESESYFTCLESEGLFLERVTECNENEIPASYRTCTRSIDIAQDPVEEDPSLEVILKEESENKAEEWRATCNEETLSSLASFHSSSSTTNKMFSAREDYLQPESLDMERKSSKRCCLEEKEQKILHIHDDFQNLEIVTVEARKNQSELRKKPEEKSTLDDITAKHEDCKEHNIKKLEQDQESQKVDKKNKHDCDNDGNVDYERGNAEHENTTSTCCVESLEVVELLPIMPEKYEIERREEKTTIGQNEGLRKIENKREEEQLVREECFSTEATYDKNEISERYTQFEQKMQTNEDEITKKEGTKERVDLGVEGNRKAFDFCELQEVSLEKFAANDMIDSNEVKEDVHKKDKTKSEDQCTMIEVDESELESGNLATHSIVDRLSKFDDEKMHNISKERKTEEACKEGGKIMAKISDNKDSSQMGLDEVCELQPITVENIQVMKYDDSNTSQQKKTMKHSLQRKKEEKVEEERCLELLLLTEKEGAMADKFSQCRKKIPHVQESNKDTTKFDGKKTKKFEKNIRKEEKEETNFELESEPTVEDYQAGFRLVSDMQGDERAEIKRQEYEPSKAEGARADKNNIRYGKENSELFQESQIVLHEVSSDNNAHNESQKNENELNPCEKQQKEAIFTSRKENRVGGKYLELTRTDELTGENVTQQQISSKEMAHLCKDIEYLQSEDDVTIEKYIEECSNTHADKDGKENVFESNKVTKPIEYEHRSVTSFQKEKSTNVVEDLEFCLNKQMEKIRMNNND
ncbi:trichohyalin-like isoform X1 [Rhopilema esculentum]|uniref:trichohyalin-like isoform X1 n=1 Tax=Rhopilema esculentum TaxID=499914 RepID=UPI0031D044C3